MNREHQGNRRRHVQDQMKVEPQSRDAHAKAHGCAAAKVRIEDKIPPITKWNVRRAG